MGEVNPLTSPLSHGVKEAGERGRRMHEGDEGGVLVAPTAINTLMMRGRDIKGEMGAKKTFVCVCEREEKYRRKKEKENKRKM